MAAHVQAWYVLRWAHLTFPTMSYAFWSVTATYFGWSLTLIQYHYFIAQWLTQITLHFGSKAWKWAYIKNDLYWAIIYIEHLYKCNLYFGSKPIFVFVFRTIKVNVDVLLSILLILRWLAIIYLINLISKISKTKLLVYLLKIWHIELNFKKKLFSREGILCGCWIIFILKMCISYRNFILFITDKII